MGARTRTGTSDMVISFSNEKARAYLLEHGKIYTMRHNRRKRPNCVTWMNAGRLKPKLADVRIVEIGHVQFINLPAYYIGQSGFSSMVEWYQAYRDLRPSQKAEDAKGAWLYYVTLGGDVVG